MSLLPDGELAGIRERIERDIREECETWRVRDLTTKDRSSLLSHICALTEQRDGLLEALKNLQSGIAQYLADPLRKKTCAHAELFIEVCGEQIVAVIARSGGEGKC